MGLLKAAASAVSTVLADQWKEYFYCESLSEDVLVAKGVKNTSSRSTNRGSDNIITKGSAIAVNEGQAMMIVEQGAIVEFSAEPGVFTFDSSLSPPSSRAVSARASRIAGRSSRNVSPMAATPLRTSASITSTSRRSSATSTAPPAPFPSA